MLRVSFFQLHRINGTGGWARAAVGACLTPPLFSNPLGGKFSSISETLTDYHENAKDFGRHAFEKYATKKLRHSASWNALFQVLDHLLDLV